MEDESEAPENGMQQQAIEEEQDNSTDQHESDAQLEAQQNAADEDSEDTNQLGPQDDEPMNECQEEEAEDDSQPNECHETEETEPEEAPMQEQENIPEFDPECNQDSQEGDDNTEIETDSAPPTAATEPVPVTNEDDQSKEEESAAMVCELLEKVIDGLIAV